MRVISGFTLPLWESLNRDADVYKRQGLNQLTCHYCGYTYQLPRICPACEGTDLRNRGFGTEKLEDDVKLLFPEATVARMDLDTDVYKRQVLMRFD